MDHLLFQCTILFVAITDGTSVFVTIYEGHCNSYHCHTIGMSRMWVFLCGAGEMFVSAYVMITIMIFSAITAFLVASARNQSQRVLLEVIH